MSGHSHTFPGLDPPHVTAEVDLQFADARIHHEVNIATCGHSHKRAFGSFLRPLPALRDLGLQGGDVAQPLLLGERPYSLAVFETVLQREFLAFPRAPRKGRRSMGAAMATAPAAAATPEPTGVMYGYIVKRPGFCGGKAAFRNRVRVNNVVCMYKAGKTPEELATPSPTTRSSS